MFCAASRQSLRCYLLTSQPAGSVTSLRCCPNTSSTFSFVFSSLHSLCGSSKHTARFRASQIFCQLVILQTHKCISRSLKRSVALLLISTYTTHLTKTCFVRITHVNLKHIQLVSSLSSPVVSPCFLLLALHWLCPWLLHSIVTVTRPTAASLCHHFATDLHR